MEKLDRFLASDGWLNLFPKAVAYNCGFYGSDHRAAKITLNHSKWVQKSPVKKQFVFENKWIIQDGFIQKAKECWDRMADAKSLQEKLQGCSKLLEQWAEKEVGNTNMKIKALVKEINDLQANDEGILEEHLINGKERELEKLLLQEEHYWQQRSRKH